MILATIPLICAQANSVTSGAVLTLVLPLGLTLVAFVLGYFAIRRETRRRAGGE